MCGIFAAFGNEHAAGLTYRGLHAQQHRAIEYAGIVASTGTLFSRHRGEGSVGKVFKNPADLEKLKGPYALGHIRYATVEDIVGLDNTQPLVIREHDGFVAFAHNGNLTNFVELRDSMHAALQTSMDSEIILRLYSRSKGALEEKVRDTLSKVRGSYAAVFMLPYKMVAVRDPSGNRPLSLGRLGEGYVLASESCAFDAVGAEFMRDIEPGEMLIISKSGLESHRLEPLAERRAQCIFEPIYYAHPSSKVFNEPVSAFRKRMGVLLEDTCPTPGGEVVVPVPDSANFIAQGYAASGRSGDYTLGITRSHYVGRTFIAAGQETREARVRGKFQVVADEIAGKSVVLVDDSIVRMTTFPPLLKIVRQAKPREIHVRIACPPITHPCVYGINTPSALELAANKMSVEEMQTKLGVDSLKFLSIDALRGLTTNPDDYCYACMTGDYPLLE